MPKVKHAMHKTSVYRRWIYMKGRCARDPNYLSAGITVCERWVDSFENFYADMGDPPSPKHTLDRIDGTRGYSPDNCRWATVREQNRNLRTNARIKGELVVEIAERAGVSRTAVKYRAKQGLPLDAPPIQDRPTCKAGHEWTDENTYLAVVSRKNGGTRVQRYCRACRAQHQADLRTRRKLNPKRT